MRTFRKTVNIVLLISFILLTLTIAKVQAADWYDPNWGYRKIIIVQPGQVTNGPHAEFPMLVSISSDADLAAKAQPDFDDILFTSSDGTTKLNHEIESYNSGTGALVAWVNIPAPGIDDGTVIYMYYGYGVAGNQQNVTGTWNNNYKGVWHLKEDPAGTGTLNLYQDSTINNEDGDDYVSDTGKTGRINGGQEFDASDDYIQLDGLEFYENNTVWTFSAWIAGTSNSVFSEGVNGTVPFFVIRSSLGALNVTTINSSWVTNINITSNAADVFDGTWNHIAITDNNGNVAIYINGTFDNSNSYTRSGSFTGIFRAAIGAFRRSSTNGFFNGTIDEVRLSASSHSAGWIQTEWRNQDTPASFSGVGSEVGISATITWTGVTDTAWDTASNWDIGEVPADTHSVIIANAGSQPSTLGSDTTIAGLTINAGAELNTSGSNYTLNVAGDIDIDGTLTANGSTISIGGYWNSAGGTFNRDSSTVELTGNCGSTCNLNSASIFLNLTISAGADVTVGTDMSAYGNMTISGTFTVPDTVTFTLRQWVNETITINPGGVLDGVGTFVRVIDDTGVINSHLVNNGSITVDDFVYKIREWGTPRAITATTYGGNLMITEWGSLDWNSYLGCATEPACPDLIVSGTLSINDSRIGKTITLDNSVYDIPITAGQLLIGDPAEAGCGNLITGNSTINISGNITINQDVAPEDCVNTVNATDGTPAINASGNWTNNDGPTAFMAGSSVVTFNGSADQTITSGGAAFNNLTLNNTGSAGNDDIIINGLLDIDGDLTITDGDLDLAVNNPDVNTSGNVTINLNGSITGGTGTWTFDGTTSFTDNSSSGPQNLGNVTID